MEGVRWEEGEGREQEVQMEEGGSGSEEEGEVSEGVVWILVVFVSYKRQ